MDLSEDELEVCLKILDEIEDSELKEEIENLRKELKQLNKDKKWYQYLEQN